MYMKTKKIIEKWYQLLRFPKEYDDAFYAALETIEVPEDASLASYDLKCQAKEKAARRQPVFGLIIPSSRQALQGRQHRFWHSYEDAP